MLYVGYVKIPSQTEVQHIKNGVAVKNDVIGITRRINRVLGNQEAFYSLSLLDLLTSLRTLGVVSPEDQQVAGNPHTPNHKPLQTIWEALQLGIRSGYFAMIVANDGHGDVILCKYEKPPQTQEQFKDKLASSPGMFKNTRGYGHYLDDIYS